MITGYTSGKPCYDTPDEAIEKGFSNRAFSQPYRILNQSGGRTVRAIMVVSPGKEPHWGYTTSPGTKIRTATYQETKKCKRWVNAQVR